MKLDFIPLDKLAVSKANMRYAKRPPDVSDILPTVRARGILVPLIVRPQPGPEDAEGHVPEAFEIVAGSRRFHAARIVADEAAQAEPVPCAILDAGDDAAAIEASLIENLARLDPDEVTQWETFTRLVKEGRTPEDIAATFGLPELTVKRVLALGNLLPRIRQMYAREEIDRTTVRHLTLASKSQQRAWLALADDPDAYLPTGHQLKAWLFGGQSIAVRHALFDLAASGLVTIADLFGEDSYFADTDAFWTAQDAAVEARRAEYLDAGWADAVIVPVSEHFHSWEYEKAAKRKGGRVYIDVRASGEVVFHEGYLSRREARRATASDGDAAAQPKPSRPEVSGPMQVYIDLHRHAAARAALLAHPGVALRLMVAHAIAGSHLWSVRAEPQSARNDETRESVETAQGETVFDERRRAVLGLLGFSPDEPTVVEGSVEGADGDPLAALFWRLLDLPDAAVMDVIAVIMGESLAAGSAAVEAVGLHIDLDMADWWQADPAFFELVRDREVLAALVADVAGEAVAAANAREKGKTLKRIVADHLDGANGREKRERWVPKWMAFPPAAYTARGGVGTVRAHALAEAARVSATPPEPPAAPAAVARPDHDPAPASEAAEPVPLAA
ncbi:MULTISPECIES: ParB/RepB/Spo0J family partition protein [Sphingomonadaceae]|uniref:Chromosome partitioning protein ParB n=2 Tax=Sphingomonadaceae TaxID=41297 RepID=A0A2A4BA66_9SPHN|nr:ParB/RepB/Spo0J family partition protein [Sphingomonas spermidinifaciens]PCD04659.1 chromosome partitioning protein ParB [Sphingomonas spermidinifaciens]